MKEGGADPSGSERSDGGSQEQAVSENPSLPSPVHPLPANHRESDRDFPVAPILPPLRVPPSPPQNWWEEGKKGQRKPVGSFQRQAGARSLQVAAHGPSWQING